MSNDRYIKDLLCSFVSAGEDMLAFSLYDGKEKTDITYSHFAKDILKAGRYFVEHNISNQHIALVAPNSYNWLVTFFAILASGNVAVLLNSAESKDILQWQIEKADVNMICADVETKHEIKDMNTDIVTVCFEQLKGSVPLHLDEISSTEINDTVLMIFTSGTTEKSKVVEITAGNLEYSMNNANAMFDFQDTESAISILPLFHVAGLRNALSMLQRFKTLYIGRGARYLLMDMPIFNPTYVILVPAIVEVIVKVFKKTTTKEERQKYVGTKLDRICIGGAAIKPSVCEYLVNLGFKIDMGYALSETTGDATWCVLDEKHMGTIGKPCGDTKCCIQDGELLIKGPAVMKGYYKEPEETAKVIKDGWLHTGDMGYCDEDGYYYITGRKKNVIILSNGENVNPEEIEAKFYECESILECMVYSDGKGICADVYSEKEKVAAEYIRQYNESMPMYRQVYKVNYFVTPLEKTGSGKIKRKENL